MSRKAQEEALWATADKWWDLYLKGKTTKHYEQWVDYVGEWFKATPHTKWTVESLEGHLSIFGEV